MDERLQRLQALLNAQQLAFNQASVGRRCEVLLERPGRKPGQLVGKIALAAVGPPRDRRRAIGDIVEVEVCSPPARTAWPAPQRVIAEAA